MSVFERSQVDILRRRLAETPERIIAIFGPRQTGKTTIVRQALRRLDRKSHYLAVDEPDPATPSLRALQAPLADTMTMPRVRDVDWLVRHWETTRREAEGETGRGFVLVFDEIQKLAGWSDAVKGLWDADRARGTPLHVVILGSAPLLMQSGLNESLAGRFEPIYVTHWSFSEMAEAFGFTLDQYPYFGGYPGVARSVRDETRWRSQVLHALVEPNIEKDVLAMVRVDKPALLRRLFALGADHSGQILSYNKMLGQLQDAGNTTTLTRYLDLLSKAGLLAGIAKYVGQSHRRRGSSPKLNVLNTALMTAGSGYTFDEARADRTRWGRIVESAVGAHLFNTRGPGLQVHYWRESSHEVDFVLKRGPRLVTVEVKSGSKRGNPRGMEEFSRRFQPERSLVVGADASLGGPGGAASGRHTLGVSLDEFLGEPAGAWFQPS